MTFSGLHSPRSMYFMCCGPQGWTQDSRWDLRSGDISRENLLPGPAAHLVAFGHVWLSGLQEHIVGTFLLSNTPKSFFPWAALHPFSTQPLLVLGIAQTQEQDFGCGLVEFHEVCPGSHWMASGLV